MELFKKKILLGSLTLMLLGVLFVVENSSVSASRSSKIIVDVSPNVAQRPLSEIGPDANLEIRELMKVVYALERYKLDHRSYPISSSSRQRWDGILSLYGESREDWIRGLVPDYLDVLPRDPRMLSDGGRQYIYKSNGANYKLIVHGAFNCQSVKETYPSLVDPVRDCFAYGFWTEKAERW